jgi:hypothetical protein
MRAQERLGNEAWDGGSNPADIEAIADLVVERLAEREKRPVGSDWQLPVRWRSATP